MKVLFIESEILSREKILKLISCERVERYSGDQPYLITLYDSPYTSEDLMNALEVSHEIRNSVEDNKVVIILSGESRSNKLTSDLNVDFQRSGNLTYKNFSIELDQQEVYINSKRVKLSALEYRLLLFFLHNVKKLIPRDAIIAYLWGQNESRQVSEANMYTHIKNLKKKLIRSGVGNFIHTLYGQGYKFEDPDEVLV